MNEEIITMTLQEDSPIEITTDQFIKGDKGDAATIKVGSVKTVAPGNSAKVTNSGNEHEAVFDFELPQGATGRTSTIAVESVVTGAEKTNAKVENLGTAEDAKFRFTIPRGDTGKAATISIAKVETGAPGSAVIVTNTGTEFDAVLNITIPSGIQGVKGDPGKDFSIEKTYTSILAMNADKNNIKEGSFVIIASNTEDEDNSKLFVKTATEFKFLTDLSGAQGFKGEKGDTATVKVGTITTLSPTAKATVSNVGTENDAVFNFGIPQGADGKAASIKVGTVETTNDNTAAVSNSGSASDAVFDFKIPQGKPATIKIGSVITGDAGSEAEVTNSGTAGDVVLDFVVPRGDKGQALSLKGSFDNESELRAAHPTGEENDAYLVDGDMYVWDVSISDWKNVGKIQGPKGDTGKAATVSVGAVTSGVTASVKNVGTENDAKFDFVLEKGDKGDAATISVGTVETVAAGANAEVANAGTKNNARLNFKIPQGLKGDTSTIKVGTVSSGANASVTNSGTNTDAVLDFVLPKGDTGSAATISVGTVSTGVPGSEVIIENAGTENAAKINFTIPQGQKGDAATVKVGKVSAGDSASVKNSGTDNDAIFDFVLPKGDKGDMFTYDDLTPEQIQELAKAIADDTDYATKDYVMKYGGKIDTISLNGTALTIENKNVDIPATQVVIKRWAADETI